MLLLAGIGCESSEALDVQGASEASDLGSVRGELVAAARAARKAGPTPAAYRAFAEKIEGMRPRLDPALTELAERKLAFLAARPLMQAADLPPSEQAEKLALTVWPTAILVAPKKGETGPAYLERVCGQELALECKYVVPEYRPLVVSAVVWRRFKERAREAVSDCRRCQDDPSFEQVLETFDTIQTELSGKVALLGDTIHPKSWPQAGAHASPWSRPPLLAIDAEGATSLDGKVIASGAWRKRIASARKGEVLGVHLLPSAEVKRLESLVRGARAAGYKVVALQARSPDYPFSLREYRIATGGRGDGVIAVDVSGQDTIQVLVQAFEVALEGAAADSGTALLRF